MHDKGGIIHMDDQSSSWIDGMRRGGHEGMHNNHIF